MKKTLTILLLTALPFFAFSQTDKKDAFERISTEMKNFTVDTSAVPNDSLSDAIRELRSTKGGLNITEVIQYKIAEDLGKKDIKKEAADKLNTFYTAGNGKRWLENAVIWIYRKQFTLAEVNDLIQFYQSPAGKKMASAFPIVVIQATKAAEQITEQFKQGKVK